MYCIILIFLSLLKYFSCFQKKAVAAGGGGGGGAGGAGGGVGANTDDLQARLDDLRRGDDD